MSAPQQLKDLIQRFNTNKGHYLISTYVEASLRQDFLDPFLRCLGWDVGNEQGLPEHLREVVIESRIDVEGVKRAPDYAFRIGGVNKFFIEAKKPSVRLKHDPAPAHQIRTYGWNGRVAYSVLTDFQEFCLYDTRIQPSQGDKATVARLHYLTYEDYATEWDWIAERFHRDSVAAGTLDKIAKDERVRRGSVPVDAAILSQIESWRLLLASDIHQRNPALDANTLSGAVQTLLDRILFLRICEDRGIEPYNKLRDLGKRTDIYGSLIEVFERADDRYNSGLFHLRDETGRPGDVDRLTPSLDVGDEPLATIFANLYWPNSPFNFRMLGAQVLGNVYEQFLGSQVELTDGEVAVVEKPEVKKSGGVVYTPEMVVEHILDVTLERALSRLSIAQVVGSGRAAYAHPFRVVDPACGSGSFLIAVYQHLLDWYLEQYIAECATWSVGRSVRIFRGPKDEWLLTTTERKRILLDHVYGVDIDEQAVEVTKLSLLLKVLENESADTVDLQLQLLHERALPDLDANIRCGNSLIDEEYYGTEPGLIDDVLRSRKINPFSWSTEFPAVFNVPRPGFDVVVGNPPYVVIQDEFRDDLALQYYRENFNVAAFKIDLYHLFMERCQSLLRPGGYVGLITPSNWLTNNSLVELRRFMLDSCQLQEIGILDRGVFHGRSVDCAIYAAQAEAPNNEFTLAKYVPDLSGNFLIQTQASILDTTQIRQSSALLFTGGGSSAGASAALTAMAAQPLSLGKVANVNFGKQLRARAAFPRDVIQVAKPDAVPDGYRPCYTGRDVTRWSTVWTGLACLDDDVAQSGGTWNPRVQNAADKVLCRQVGLFPDFGIDELGFQCLNTMFMITTTADDVSPWYLLGVLNSLPVRAFWVDRFWDRRRTFPKIKGTYLKDLPLPSRHDDEVEALARALTRHKKELASEPQSGRRTQLERSIQSNQAKLDARIAALFRLAPSALTELAALVEEAGQRQPS